MLKSKKSARFSPFIAILLLFNSIFLNVHAVVPLSSTDTLYPGTVGQIEEDGRSYWGVTDLERIKAEDGTMIGLGLRGGSKSSYMTASNFSMSIPTSAIISGIQVEIGKAYFGDTPLVDYSVRLINASGNLVGSYYGNTSDGWNVYPSITTEIYGGSSDLWGLASISVSDLMSPNFGVAFAAQNPGSSTDYTSAFVDFIRIKVYYSVEQIAPELNLVNSPVIYSGSPKIAEVTCSVAGIIEDIKYNGSSEAPIDAGTYQITADFVPDDTTLYLPLNDYAVGDFVINQDVPSLMVDNPTVAYTGFQQSATVSSSIPGTVEDIRYNNSSVVPTDPGTYTVTADFTPDDYTNFSSLSDAFAGTFEILAPPTLYNVTVTVNIEGGGTAYGEGAFEEGDSVAVNAIANPAYNFVNWTVDGLVVSNDASYSFTMGTADITLTANFEAKIIPTPVWPKGIRLSATAITSTSVTLLLSKPVPDAQQYIVRWNGGEEVFDASSGTSFAISGLIPSTSYKFQIQVVIGGVESENGPSKGIKTKR